jgi:O-acetyl-ADP-ribose deacetylase (regulator of RNase III)
MQKKPISNPSTAARPIFRLGRGDITRQHNIDAIVTIIPSDLSMEGGLNSAILAAAGHDLDDFILDNIYKPQKGDAFVLPGFGLPCPHLIVCIMPSRLDTVGGDEVHLLRAYRHSLMAAQRMGLKRIAYPALGTGHRQYPAARAARLAIQGIEDRLKGGVAEIRFVCDRDETLKAFAKRLKEGGYL